MAPSLSLVGRLIGNAHRIPTDGYALIRFSGKVGIEVVAIVAIPLLLLALAAIGGNMIQHRLVWSAEGLKPKMSKVSPIAGLGRLFSKTAVINFVKGLAKLGIIGTVMTMLLWPERDRLESLVATDVTAVLLGHGCSLRRWTPPSVAADLAGGQRLPRSGTPLSPAATPSRRQRGA